MHFTVKHYFKDSKSQDQLFKHYDVFKEKNQKDAKQDYSYGYTVPGMVERTAFYTSKPCCDYSTWLYIFAAVGLLWPFSLIVESRVSRFDVEIAKVATIDP